MVRSIEVDLVSLLVGLKSDISNINLLLSDQKNTMMKFHLLL